MTDDMHSNATPLVECQYFFVQEYLRPMEYYLLSSNSMTLQRSMMAKAPNQMNACIQINLTNPRTQKQNSTKSNICNTISNSGKSRRQIGCVVLGHIWPRYEP
jgi:hypothetical protein